MKLIGLFLAACAAACALSYCGLTTFSVTMQEEQALRSRMGCVPTNEFVGRSAERLWLCANGIKYPTNSFYGMAYQEKRAARGW